MTSSRSRAAVLAIAASGLAGCATARSDDASCPPVVAYSREFLVRAADELDSLPADSAIGPMLADDPVMRDQARACGRFDRRAGSGGSAARSTRCRNVNHEEHARVPAEFMR